MSSSNNVRINDANVIDADIIATNGVIHAIDTVLVPEQGETTDPPTILTSSIVDIASGDDRFSTLVAAITAADLGSALMGDGPLTVFGKRECITISPTLISLLLLP